MNNPTKHNWPHHQDTRAGVVDALKEVVANLEAEELKNVGTNGNVVNKYFQDNPLSVVKGTDEVGDFVAFRVNAWVRMRGTDANGMPGSGIMAIQQAKNLQTDDRIVMMTWSGFFDDGEGNSFQDYQYILVDSLAFLAFLLGVKESGLSLDMTSSREYAFELAAPDPDLVN